MKKNIRKVAAMLLILVVLGFVSPVMAATSSYGTQTRTITVTTKANWFIPGSESITLSQTKGTCVEDTYNIFTGKWSSKTSKVYGDWDIVATATDGSHTVRKNLSGSSVKINLKPNKTYKITVSWDYASNTITQLDKGSFKSYPTWRVKSTYKVSSCY